MTKRLNISILFMGFSGLVAQMLLLRELLIVFSGNELSIGLILANWLLLEAIGSFFVGKRAENIRNKIAVFVLITIIFSLSLFAAIYATRILKNILGISIGQSVGILPIFISSFLILLPTSITHGALFTFGCKVHSLFSGHGASSTGKVYVYETLGTIAGGITWTYLFIQYLNAFQTATIIALLNFFLCAALLLSYWQKSRLSKVMTVISCILFIFSVFFIFSGTAEKMHKYSVESQWKAQSVVHYQNSIYGNICVIESGGQYTFFLDGLAHMITPVPDITFIEEFVHLPLLAHPLPSKVLILSGGAGGMVDEILKHSSVEKIEYTELDPLTLELVRKFPTDLTENELTDARVVVRHIDGRLLLNTTDESYDVIFIGLPGPSDLQTNRFFTKEFFLLAQKRLSKDGILVFSLPGSLAYLNDELRDLNACIFNTAKSAFSYVRVLPGDGANIFLVSNSEEISTIDIESIIERLDERGIEAEVIIPRNIYHKLHHGWTNWFSEFLDGGTKSINHDFKPLGMFYSTIYWNSVFSPYLVRIFRWFEKLTLQTFIILFIIVFFIIMFLKKNRKALRQGIPLCVVTTGFAGMMLDLALIFTFQAIYGYVFSWIGLLVSFFMAGAAIGAIIITSALGRIKNDKGLFIKIDLSTIGFSFILPFIFLIMSLYLQRPAAFVFLKGVFLFLAVISGFLIGAQFPLANRIYLKNSGNFSRAAGLIYGADLLGGWLGGIIGGIVLLPILGLLGSCIVVVLLKTVSLIIVSVQP